MKRKIERDGGRTDNVAYCQTVCVRADECMCVGVHVSVCVAVCVWERDNAHLVSHLPSIQHYAILCH